MISTFKSFNQKFYIRYSKSFLIRSYITRMCNTLELKHTHFSIFTRSAQTSINACRLSTLIAHCWLRLIDFQSTHKRARGVPHLCGGAHACTRGNVDRRHHRPLCSPLLISFSSRVRHARPLNQIVCVVYGHMHDVYPKRAHLVEAHEHACAHSLNQ